MPLGDSEKVADAVRCLPQPVLAQTARSSGITTQTGGEIRPPPPDFRVEPPFRHGIAKQFGVDQGTMQRNIRPFEGA